MKKLTVSKVVWFSRFFGIECPQYELPFVDFNLYSDVPLYLDPYAITKDPSDLGAECHNTIISYFQSLLDAIQSDDKVHTRRLIHQHLTEPNEIHLGVGMTARRGRGIGNDQEQQIVNALANSEAVKTGAIHDIQELELHIPRIGPDKISDLVANLILASLAKFTEFMCSKYGISTRPCAVSGFWNQERQEWDGGYFNLPAYKTHSYILVPKRFIRREHDLMNHREFYNKYVLDIIERELINANDSLVQTLKNGKRRVNKKDMQADPRFALSKEFISRFILEHPDTIEAYRTELQKRFTPADPAAWSGKSKEDDPEIELALTTLKTLPSGRQYANDYHEIVFKLLQFLFDWSLENFEKEYEMDGGRGRIDIIADNYANGGLFAELRDTYNMSSVPIECKNYASDLGNNEFNQLCDRLSSKTSRFGMIFCRTITDYMAMLKHRTDRWLHQEKVILLIDDERLRGLIQLRLARKMDAIQSQLRIMIREVKFGGQSSA